MSKKVIVSILELRHLVKNQTANFELAFTQEFINSIKLQLNLSSLQKANFFGSLAPLGQGGWRLAATISATVEQQCSVTLEPVFSSMESSVLRNFRGELSPLSDNQSYDETSEADEVLGKAIYLETIFCEELSLLLPDYPKVKNINYLKNNYGPPGSSPLNDETSKPFAILSDFMKKLS
jgi:uncharacterized metal-binding protein YceD (DUF177 family)